MSNNISHYENSDSTLELDNIEENHDATENVSTNAILQSADVDAATKSEPSVAVTGKYGDDSSPSSSPSDGHGDRTWKTTFFRFGPLAGLFGIALAVASLFASLGVLVGSNRAPVADWDIQPAALLAIFTAIGNQSMRFAAWNGVAVAWWVRASRSESTIGQLHRDWRSGTTIRGAIMAGRHIGWLGLACIFSTIVAIDGPLLQRATDVKLVPIEGVTADLEVRISPEIPTDFTGTWIRLLANETTEPLWNSSIPTSSGPVPNNIQGIANTKFLEGPTVTWLNDTTMSGFISGCPKNCTAEVMAPAAAKTSCTSHKVKANYSQILQGPYSGVVHYPLDSLILLIRIGLLLGEYESIDLVTGFRSSCEEQYFQYTACTLQPAVGMYSVQISDGTVTLLSASPTIVSLANNTRVNHTYDASLGGHVSTLAGIVNQVSDYWSSIFAAGIADGEPLTVGYGTGSSEIFLATHGGVCDSNRDPQSYIIESLNTFMFRTGVFAASPVAVAAHLPSAIDPGLSYTNRVTAQLNGVHDIYVTTFKWFGAAVIVEIVCIALVLPTYYGWWKLGRSVSLSPLETAKAFEAPALDSSHSNSTGADIAKALGEAPIRYGAATTAQGLTKLALGDPKSIHTPEKDAQISL